MRGMILLDALFPKICVGCGRWGTYLCPQCGKLLAAADVRVCPKCRQGSVGGRTHTGCRRALGPDGLTSAFLYRGPARPLVKLLKYRLVRDAGQTVKAFVPPGTWESLAAATRLSPVPVRIVPVPLHPARLRWRGFNQAQIIAAIVSDAVGRPMDTGLVVRTVETSPQAGMTDRAARIRNMRSAFACTRDPSAFGIIIVDDVYTTGATLSSVTHALKRAGCPWVWGFTLCR